jgi:nicotinate-nucleotide adenylyltransferase
MKRIGIFGGSFNPIHLGHTALAAYICEQGLVDEVWLMVSPHNPLKENSTLINEQERLAMARLAVAPYPTLRACDFEFTLPRPSYTYHTLQALRKAYPDHEFSLIIGEDNWQCFDRWYRGEDIARETPIIVYPRDIEGELKIISAKQESLLSSGEGGGRGLPKLLPYSSTEVRQAIAEGKDTSHMLHPDVAQYIKENHLYTTR